MSEDISIELKDEILGFNEEELLQYIKWAVQKLYNSIKDEEEINVKCKEELIKKLNEEKTKYRISKNTDSMSVQFARLFDYEKKDNEIYIQVYLSIYFYDDVHNNRYNMEMRDKYWNDIWIVTCKERMEVQVKNSKCPSCGAVMKYKRMDDIFECTYCENIIENRFNSKWELVDIELGN